MEIVVAQPSDRQRIQAFYAASRYGSELDPLDRVLLAVSGPTLAGVVRLCREHGILVVRGLQVAPAFRRRGVGRALLGAATAAAGGEDVYVLPYRHLERFYRHAGFVPAPESELPHFLGERLRSYLATGRAVIALRRPARWDAHAGTRP